jgi:hypothetical protein
MLMGGNPFMYANTATHDEIMASFDYIEMMGYAPVLTGESKKGIRDGAQLNIEQGIPNILPFPVWDAPEVTAEREAVSKEYSNTNPAYYQDYFDAVQVEGRLRAEVPVAAQDMYMELTKVMQAVLTDENADTAALLKTADANFQQILDDNVNR